MLIALLALAALLLAGLVALNVAYIRHLDTKDRRHDEQIDRLLQRIQAPQLAVIEHSTDLTQTPPSVDTTDDEDYWKAQEEALDRITTLEREGL